MKDFQPSLVNMVSTVTAVAALGHLQTDHMFFSICREAIPLIHRLENCFIYKEVSFN